MDKDRLAKDFYDDYCEAVGGVAFNGDPLPSSEEFFNDPSKQKQANAYRKAAERPWNMLKDVTANLGNPAYGHSSSNTIAIDELREKTFDYLGVEKN